MHQCLKFWLYVFTKWWKHNSIYEHKCQRNFCSHVEFKNTNFRFESSFLFQIAYSACATSDIYATVSSHIFLILSFPKIIRSFWPKENFSLNVITTARNRESREILITYWHQPFLAVCGKISNRSLADRESCLISLSHATILGGFSAEVYEISPHNSDFLAYNFLEEW
jgi:hypothetical protein